MNSLLFDQAGPIRKGEELDLDAIERYVRGQVPGLEGPCRLGQFPGGASNLTYLLDFSGRQMVLRRPPFGTKAKTAHDMKREYQVMQRLAPHYPCVPKMVAYCEDETIMGCSFYLMERLQGIILRADLPIGLELNPQQVHRLCLNLIDKLVDLHKVDYFSSGLSDLGKSDGYVTRQVEGWSKRYRASRTPNVPEFEKVMEWLDRNKPEQRLCCVIHNDFRFDNVILNPESPTEIIGVLDWEMSTLGDPLMDLGNSLAYWVQADDDDLWQKMRRQPTHLPGMLTRQEVVDYYCEKMGFPAVDFTFYRVYGLFRLAVIAQQIYYRFYHGQTKDKRFESFYLIVAHLEWLCLREIS